MIKETCKILAEATEGNRHLDMLVSECFGVQTTIGVNNTLMPKFGGGGRIRKWTTVTDNALLLIKKGKSITIHIGQKPKSEISASGNTLPLAICIAALLDMEKEV